MGDIVIFWVEDSYVVEIRGHQVKRHNEQLMRLLSRRNKHNWCIKLSRHSRLNRHNRRNMRNMRNMPLS